MTGLAEALKIRAIEEHAFLTTMLLNVVDLEMQHHASTLHTHLCLISKYLFSQPAPSSRTVPATHIVVAALVFLLDRMLRTAALCHECGAPRLSTGTQGRCGHVSLISVLAVWADSPVAQVQETEAQAGVG
jgi:hypothetical protein